MTSEEARKYLLDIKKKEKTADILEIAKPEPCNNDSKPEPNEEPVKEKDELLFSLAKQFDTSKPVEKTEFIAGIYPRRYLTIEIGQPGTGKSWKLQKICSDLSLGGTILNGLATNEPARKILFFVGELGADGMNERAQLAQWKANKENFLTVTASEAEKQNISLLLNENIGQENITKLVKHFNPDLVVFDSIISFFDGDEKNNKEVAPAIKFLTSLAENFNCSVIGVHHSRKRLSAERVKPLALDDVIGGSAISRLAALVIANEIDENIDGAIRVSCLKSWFKKFKDFSYRLKDGLYNDVQMTVELNIPTRYEATTQIKNTQREATLPEFIKMFLIGKGSEGANNEEIATATGKTTEEIKMPLRRLCQKGEIKNPRRGFYIIPLIRPDQTSGENSKPEPEEQDTQLEFDFEESNIKK